METPDTIIVSFPRSGLNWIRYCTELLTGLPTPGPKVLVGGGKDQPFAFNRTHCVTGVVWANPGNYAWDSVFDEKGNCKYKKVILLLRNFYENFAGRDGGEDISRMVIYATNIQFYHAFPGEKMMVYYEELIKGPKHMVRILDFLGFHYDISDFDYEANQLKSLELYKSRRGIDTDANADSPNPNGENLNDTTKSMLNSVLVSQLGPLFRYYLGKYSQ